MNPTFMDMFGKIPAIGKYKAYIASAALMLAGLSGMFHALGDFSSLILSVVEMKISVWDFVSQAPQTLQPATAFFLGYLGLGVRHAQDKVVAEVKTIK